MTYHLANMLPLFIIVCVVGATEAAPAPHRNLPSQDEIEELKTYLGKAIQPANTTLEEAMARTPWASAWENSGKFEGDILLMEDEVKDMVTEYSSGQRTGLPDARNRWPGNTVIYQFAPGHFTAAQQNQITAAFNMFNTRTCVRFRVRTNERDFVRVSGYSDGCYAHVGYFPGFGAHTLNLAPRGCLNHFIIIHEWLHSVGFHHMHQTYNRYDWIWINWANVQNGVQFAFSRFTNQQVTMLGLPYEYASNMHYGPTAFSTNGRPTIVARFSGGEQMGQLQFVTGWDIQRVNRLYNCPGLWNTTLNEEDANKPAYTYEETEQENAFVNAVEENKEKNTFVNAVEENEEKLN